MAEDTTLTVAALELTGAAIESANADNPPVTSYFPVVSSSGNGDAYIGATNWLTDPATTKSADGTTPESAAELVTSTRWDAASGGTVYYTVDLITAREVGCFGIYGHNLESVAGVVSVEYSDDNTAWTAYGSAVSPTSGNVIFRVPGDETHRYWRFKFVTSGAFYATVLHLGPVLQLPGGMRRGFVPPTLARDSVVLNEGGNNGAFLARRLLRSIESTDFTVPNVAPAYVRASWLAFMQHAERFSFFFSWDAVNFPDEAAYCFSDGDLPAANYHHAWFQNVGANLKAFIE